MDDLSAKRPLRCPLCDLNTIGTVRGTAVSHGRDEGVIYRDGPALEHVLVQCDNCGEAVLQMREDHGGPGGFDLETSVVVYPSSHLDMSGAPVDVVLSWQNATASLDAGAHLAAVTMVRRVVDIIAKDRGARRGSLAKRLKDLRREGLLDPTLADWADELRILGNAGAHPDGAEITEVDALDAVAFGEALIRYEYVYKARFEALRERRRPYPNDPRGH